MSFAFINIFSTKEEALSIRYSPLTYIRENNGIQLLPFQQNKYVQTSDVREGIELEDWQVFAISVCGNQRTDITENFNVERVFQDDNGVAQIDWSLLDLPDMGYEMIYLEITQLIDPSQTWYTSMFQISAYEAENTARIDYFDDIYGTRQSVQFQMFWWFDSRKFELTSYREVSTSITKTVTSSSSRFEVWLTNVVNRNYILMLTELFDLTYMYVDYVRCYPYEASEIPDLEEAENFTQYRFTLSFDKNDIFDPNAEIPEPVLLKSIDFEQIMYLGNNRVALYYTAYNFNPPDVQVQYGMNGTVWNPEAIAFLNSASPLIMTLPYPYQTLTYLRIFSNIDQVYSVTRDYQVDQPLTINSVTANYNSTLNRWVLVVNYNMAYYNGSNVVLVTTKNAGTPLEGTEPNDGSITRNLLANFNDTIKVVLKSVDGTFISEEKTITLQ